MYLVLSQYTRLTDRWTEFRQQYHALHYMQSHGKNAASYQYHSASAAFAPTKQIQMIDWLIAAISTIKHYRTSWTRRLICINGLLQRASTSPSPSHLLLSCSRHKHGWWISQFCPLGWLSVIQSVECSILTANIKLNITQCYVTLTILKMMGYCSVSRVYTHDSKQRHLLLAYSAWW